MHIITVFAGPTAIDMPFADMSRCIAQGLKILSDSILLWIERPNGLRFKDQLTLIVAAAIDYLA